MRAEVALPHAFLNHSCQLWYCYYMTAETGDAHRVYTTCQTLFQLLHIH